MATFRLFVAVCQLLGIPIFQGDNNAAYLNALLAIKQNLESLEGYPCKTDGMVYVVQKALYGLKQSGREWSTEVNGWFLRYGFNRCATESCLYYYNRDGEFALVLLYVDGILCAIKNEDFKKKIFQKLDEDYGLKDQGLLNTYLAVEVGQNDNSIKIHQTKYCEDVIERFNFSDAHASRIPMETKMRLTVNDTDTANRKQVPENGKVLSYRELIDSLIYLATSTRPDIAHVVEQRVDTCRVLHSSTLERRSEGYGTWLDPRAKALCIQEMQQMQVVSLSLMGFVTRTRERPRHEEKCNWLRELHGRRAISWASRRQAIVALSTAEAEYVAACESCMDR
ncbi:Copia type Polyprotein [Phytophthora megakarya]|uniref:Copia type Polyprotein n=1 Tax=Phytophthora megakarya TaxID=4795 RepID=A0A225VBE3_9STRA|nr:Copia type Polyprotein [Phytophthora megakarya]